MHVQTATMGYSSGPHPGEISPTLTNPEMILPYDDFELPQDSYRADSLGDDWRSIGSGSFSIGPSHGHMMATTTPIIYGNGTMLSDIGEVTEAESTPGRKIPGPAERRMLKQAQHNRNNSPIRSSPTMGYAAGMKRNMTGSHHRKISMESTSTVKSEGQSAELFRDFDDGVSVDDSVFQGDDEESVADSYTEGVIASETHRLSRNENDLEKDDDRSSSAALSRRAEQILLNAKKRLNNMEGNLTRARSSLFVTPSGSLSLIHSSSPLSRSTPSPPVNGQRGIALGVPPSKHRQLHTPNDPPGTSPGHARVQSENSISTPLRTAPFSVRFPVRASSAAARYNGRGGAESSEPSPPLSHTPESPREDARNGTRSGYASSLSKASPPHGSALEPLNEDEAVPEFEVDRASLPSSLDGSLSPFGEHRGLTRSTSTMQMRDLRDQMSDLKGRLSVLRDRARDDTMKRRSLQSLRTPSPFTAAEQWYTSSKSYGDSPLSADGGVAQPPWKEQEREEAEAKSEILGSISPKETRNYAESEVTSIYEDVAETHVPMDQGPLIDGGEEEEEEEDEGAFDTAAEDEEPEREEQDFENDYNDEMVDRDEVDDYESDASMYHDTMAVPISHEDREDAFDYEHFFLHSAMGTIGQQRLARRGSGASFSSEDSVETTRGPALPSENHRSSKTGKERASLSHFRSDSTDTVSTMATFATAEEGPGSDNEDEEDHDNFAVQFVKTSTLRTENPATAKRSTFGDIPEAVEDGQPAQDDRSSSSSTPTMHDKERNGSSNHRPSISSFDSLESTGTTRSFPLVNKPKSNSISGSSSRNSVSSLIRDPASFKAGKGEGESPVSMLAKEDQILVERLVASLGQCVLGLQEAGHATYEGRVWRRRLDAARRVLEGQEGAV